MFGANPKQNVWQTGRYSSVSVLIRLPYTTLQLDIQNLCVQERNTMKFGRHRRFGGTCYRLLSSRKVTFVFKNGDINFVPRLVHFYETTRRQIPEHSALKSHHRARSCSDTALSTKYI